MTTGPIEPLSGAEYPISEAREKLAELAARAEEGEVIYLTRYGRRTVALVAADSRPAEVAGAARAAVSQVIDQYRDVFDKLADS
jgi:prevent-host-death family protein